MQKVGSFLVDWWRLVVPYFKSEDWRYAIPLLIAVAIAGMGPSPISTAAHDASDSLPMYPSLIISARSKTTSRPPHTNL